MKAALCLVLVCAYVVCAEKAMPGGWTDLEVDAENVQEAAKKSIELFQQTGSNNKLFLQKVISAKSQVVAGVNYQLTVSVAKGSCLKDADADECPITQIGRCHFVLYSAPWKNLFELSQSSCEEFIDV